MPWVLSWMALLTVFVVVLVAGIAWHIGNWIGNKITSAIDRKPAQPHP